jgi:hypothetical protein
MTTQPERTDMDTTINGHGSHFRADAGLITWELNLPGPIPSEVWPVLRRLQAAALKASQTIDKAIEDAIEESAERYRAERAATP